VSDAALDATGWRITVGCYVRVRGANRGRGVVVYVPHAGPSMPDGGARWVVRYRDREGRMHAAWADTCTVVPATPRAKRRQESADYQLGMASKALRRRR